MIDKKAVYRIINEVADEMGIERDVAKVAFRLFWVNMEQKISKFKFDDLKSEEEFKQLQTSFVLPGLGTYYTTWNKILKIRRKNKKWKENWKNQQ